MSTSEDGDLNCMASLSLEDAFLRLAPLPDSGAAAPDLLAYDGLSVTPRWSPGPSRSWGPRKKSSSGSKKRKQLGEVKQGDSYRKALSARISHYDPNVAPVCFGVLWPTEDLRSPATYWEIAHRFFAPLDRSWLRLLERQRSTWRDVKREENCSPDSERSGLSFIWKWAADELLDFEAISSHRKTATSGMDVRKEYFDSPCIDLGSIIPEAGESEELAWVDSPPPGSDAVDIEFQEKRNELREVLEESYFHTNRLHEVVRLSMNQEIRKFWCGHIHAMGSLQAIREIYASMAWAHLVDSLEEVLRKEGEEYLATFDDGERIRIAWVTEANLRRLLRDRRPTPISKYDVVFLDRKWKTIPDVRDRLALETSSLRRPEPDRKRMKLEAEQQNDCSRKEGEAGDDNGEMSLLSGPFCHLCRRHISNVPDKEMSQCHMDGRPPPSHEATIVWIRGWEGQGSKPNDSSNVNSLKELRVNSAARDVDAYMATFEQRRNAAADRKFLAYARDSSALESSSDRWIWRIPEEFVKKIPAECSQEANPTPNESESSPSTSTGVASDCQPSESYGDSSGEPANVEACGPSDIDSSVASASEVSTSLPLAQRRSRRIGAGVAAVKFADEADSRRLKLDLAGPRAKRAPGRRPKMPTKSKEQDTIRLPPQKGRPSRQCSSGSMPLWMLDADEDGSPPADGAQEDNGESPMESKQGEHETGRRKRRLVVNHRAVPSVFESKSILSSPVGNASDTSQFQSPQKKRGPKPCPSQSTRTWKARRLDVDAGGSSEFVFSGDKWWRTVLPNMALAPLCGSTEDIDTGDGKPLGPKFDVSQGTSPPDCWRMYCSDCLLGQFGVLVKKKVESSGSGKNQVRHFCPRCVPRSHPVATRTCTCERCTRTDILRRLRDYYTSIGGKDSTSLGIVEAPGKEVPWEKFIQSPDASLSYITNRTLRHDAAANFNLAFMYRLKKARESALLRRQKPSPAPSTRAPKPTRHPDPVESESPSTATSEVMGLKPRPQRSRVVPKPAPPPKPPEPSCTNPRQAPSISSDIKNKKSSVNGVGLHRPLVSSRLKKKVPKEAPRPVTAEPSPFVWPRNASAVTHTNQRPIPRPLVNVSSGMPGPVLLLGPPERMRHAQSIRAPSHNFHLNLQRTPLSSERSMEAVSTPRQYPMELGGRSHPDIGTRNHQQNGAQHHAYISGNHQQNGAQHHAYISGNQQENGAQHHADFSRNHLAHHPDIEALHPDIGVRHPDIGVRHPHIETHPGAGARHHYNHFDIGARNFDTGVRNYFETGARNHLEIGPRNHPEIGVPLGNGDASSRNNGHPLPFVQPPQQIPLPSAAGFPGNPGSFHRPPLPLLMHSIARRPVAPRFFNQSRGGRGMYNPLRSMPSLLVPVRPPSATHQTCQAATEQANLSILQYPPSSNSALQVEQPVTSVHGGFEPLGSFHEPWTPSRPRHLSTSSSYLQNRCES